MNCTHAQRLEKLRARMADTNTDLVAIGPSSHMLYLTGVSPHGDERPVLLMVSQGFAGFLMPALNVDSARQHTDLPFFPWTDADGPDAFAVEQLGCGFKDARPGGFGGLVLHRPHRIIRVDT